MLTIPSGGAIAYDTAGKLRQIGYKAGSGAETYYFMTRNAQGDIIALYSCDSSTLVGTYTYDAWGKVIGVTTSTDPNGLMAKNPFRYRGYYYDRETGFYYLQSRYYNPETRRFLNADNQITAGGDTTGLNLFLYCGNNPVNGVDPTGHAWYHWAIGAALALAAILAAPVLVTAGGVTIGGTAAAAAAVAEGAMVIAGAAMTAAAVEKAYDSIPRNHTVYGLVNAQTGRVEYVGRTKNPAAREQAHKNNPERENLKFTVIKSGLNAIEARGVEQIQMLYHHTINTANKMNNQINGISPSNGLIGAYMEAGRGALGYFENQISNDILYWAGN